MLIHINTRKILSDLLLSVSDIDGVKRIRYTSPHPQDINVELLEVWLQEKIFVIMFIFLCSLVLTKFYNV
ncbi:MAG: hypothetical protein CM1200mP1_10140 [Candidatus Neomarinimicrobiota bacterium]|nr:MAG: hypothetical protein CM1200mP1_10140 [Candidatus Neomarinimicrobiota bacterium]